MNITDILKKISKGEALTDEEKTFVSVYQEPKDAAKIAQLEKNVQNLTQQLADAKREKEEAERKKLPEVEQLKKDIEDRDTQIATVTAERDKALQEKGELEFASGVAQIAAQHRFNAPEYLKFLLRDKKIDPADAATVTKFMEDLKKVPAEQKFFDSEIKAGGAGSTGGQGGKDEDTKDEYAKAKAGGNIQDMLRTAPDRKTETEPNS